ncbi:SCO3374 family protein [Streptomyces sp. NPDC015220]|uniref:SCO3374 family protein n=1 Tax=Streptomyces sp. NPDC015220 TaxID=3364947 RepID=UPI003702A3F2
MVGSVSTVPLPVPLPRRPLDPADRVRHWYENELGWATAPGAPVRLVVGRRFDVLDLPLEAGRAVLRRLGPESVVAVQGDRMRLPVAAGSAEELPGLLQWLEWGALDLDLVALGAGTLMDAPSPPGAGRPGGGRRGPRGAAVWLRPPVPGREVEASLPALSALGGGGGAPDLVRLVSTAATECHRLRLRRACPPPSVLP